MKKTILRKGAWLPRSYTLHLLFSILALQLVSSCSVRHQTVAPAPIVTTQASFDGNAQNSGLIGPDGHGGFYVTAHFIERYDAMLATYGGRFSPPVKPGDRHGIQALPSGEYDVTAEMIARFRTMNFWRKAEAGA
jgi:hypothetical protein